MGDEEHEGHGSHGSSSERTTAPQSEYTTKQIALGFVIAIVGIAITFGVPLALL